MYISKKFGSFKFTSSPLQAMYSIYLLFVCHLVINNYCQAYHAQKFSLFRSSAAWFVATLISASISTSTFRPSWFVYLCVSYRSVLTALILFSSRIVSSSESDIGSLRAKLVSYISSLDPSTRPSKVSNQASVSRKSSFEIRPVYASESFLSFKP